METYFDQTIPCQISACPPSYKDSDVEARCLKRVDKVDKVDKEQAGYTYNLDLPVRSRQTRTWWDLYILLMVTMTKDGIVVNVTMILRYANIFCAACHGELKSVEHQTIRIGKAKSFLSWCSLNLRLHQWTSAVILQPGPATRRATTS